MHAGFVGTGNMGRPMATNILKAGHQLTVFDLDPAATKPLEALGATRADDLPSLAALVRVTLTSLPNDAAVEGTLAVMVGAKADDAAAFEPLLHAIGSHVFYLGEVGRGNILKLLNNVCALTNQAVLCEALALGDRLGIPRETVGEVIGRSSGASFILERKLPALVRHDYRAGFFVELARKDLGLALGLAESEGAEASVARAAFALYDAATAAGHGRLDSSGLLAYLESFARPGA